MVMIMSPVPGWFVGTCWIAAITLSICVGLNHADVRGLVMFSAAAVTSAALPGRKWFAIASAATGLVAAAWSTALVHRGIHVDLHELLLGRGPGAFALTGGWLMVASVIRAMWA